MEGADDVAGKQARRMPARAVLFITATIMLDSEERLAALASQHHASQYSRARFGPQGSPVRYLPLSLHLPDQFNQLRQRQLLVTAQLDAWWPSQQSHPVPPVSLQDEIMAAMSEPLCPTLPNNLTLKTSWSHPINISMVIPPDLVALISSHALLSSSADIPTVLEIPSSFTLPRLSSLRIPRPSSFQSNSSVPVLPVLSTQMNSTRFRTRSLVTDALQAAISSGIEKQPMDTAERLKKTVISGFPPDSKVSLSSLSFSVTMPSPIPLQSNPLQSDQQVSTGTPIAPPTPPKLPSRRSESGQALLCIRQSPNIPPTFLIGNLFLSSCPGKKVRLNGPVKGRSGVCRDLETDMKKMKNLRVGCIVCCLEDSELEFLGAPWPEYERTAKKFGIDILRLPIPEGLPPISPSSLDAHLANLINKYSLQGIPVLVHCRGGVGRAGVVACCWMIRLGLCGWLDTECGGKDTCFDQKTIAFVEKVIALIRRRRSIKAVETYEQVKFINDYVRHLCHGVIGLRTCSN